MQCEICHQPIKEFNKRNTKQCQSCYSELDRERCKAYRTSPNGLAKRAWYRINLRAENKDGKDKCYTNVKVKMTKDEFLQWAIPRYKEWVSTHPHQVPSINRIDPKGHYEINNIEIIGWLENSAKGNTIKPFNEQKFLRYILKKCRIHNLDTQTVIAFLTSNCQTTKK